MAEKDITEKILEAHNDVFADIVNVLLFQGEPYIRPEDLVDQAPRAVYKADGKIREIERDVVKRWDKGSIRIACIGLENQTEPDPDMPLRIYGYDGAEYRAQLLKENQGKARYPVVTLVLYFGYRNHWDRPLTLYEAIDIPEILKPFVPDIKINLFEIAYLTREQVNLFRSDFKVVADYFVQKRKNGNYIPSAERLVHVQETLQLLSIMTRDRRFEEAYQVRDKEEEGEIHNMCEVLDRIEKRGELRGLQIGKQEGLQIGEQMGKEQERIRNVRNLMGTLNLTARQAMDALRLPEEEREECLRRL